MGQRRSAVVCCLPVLLLVQCVTDSLVRALQGRGGLRVNVPAGPDSNVDACFELFFDTYVMLHLLDSFGAQCDQTVLPLPTWRQMRGSSHLFVYGDDTFFF